MSYISATTGFEPVLIRLDEVAAFLGLVLHLDSSVLVAAFAVPVHLSSSFLNTSMLLPKMLNWSFALRVAPDLLLLPSRISSEVAWTLPFDLTS